MPTFSSLPAAGLALTLALRLIPWGHAALGFLEETGIFLALQHCMRVQCDTHPPSQTHTPSLQRLARVRSIDGARCSPRQRPAQRVWLARPGLWHSSTAGPPPLAQLGAGGAPRGCASSACNQL